MNPQTFLLCVIVMLFVAVVLMFVLLQKARKGRKLKPGDIVFYVNPGVKDKLNNMITLVMDASLSKGTTLILGHGNTLEGSTTCVVLTRNLHLLPVDQNYPIQVPGEPVLSNRVRSITDDFSNNDATWGQVPLSWFTYHVHSTRK